MAWSFFTNFGNSALLIPLGALASVLLWRLAGRQLAVLWLLAFLAGAALVALSKIAFFGWGFGVPAWDMTCLSGHTYLAGTVWPLLSWLGLRRLLPRLAVVPGIVLALVVAYSRIETHAHSVSEVIGGAVLAALVLVLLWQCTRRWRPAADGEGPWPMATAGLLVLGISLVLGTEQKLPTERLFKQIGTTLSGAARPMDRASWLRQWRLRSAQQAR